MCSCGDDGSKNLIHGEKTCGRSIILEVVGLVHFREQAGDALC